MLCCTCIRQSIPLKGSWPQQLDNRISCDGCGWIDQSGDSIQTWYVHCYIMPEYFSLWSRYLARPQKRYGNYSESHKCISACSLMLWFAPILFPLTSFLGHTTASHCPLAVLTCCILVSSLAVPKLYYTCVFLCFSYAYLCSAVLVAAYSVSFSYLLFCMLPQQGYTYLSI